MVWSADEKKVLFLAIISGRKFLEHAVTRDWGGWCPKLKGPTAPKLRKFFEHAVARDLGGWCPKSKGPTGPKLRKIPAP